MPHLWLTTNDVTTDRVHAAPAAHVFAQAETACRSLPRWTVTKTDAAAGTLTVEVRTAFGGFTDDVTVLVTPDGPDAARVTVRSRSRVGRGDFGENARHIRALLRALDVRLAHPD